MINELLRTSSLSFFVSISYHTFPHLSSVLDNFFGKIFWSVFLYTYTSVVYNCVYTSGAVVCDVSLGPSFVRGYASY